MSLKSFGLSNHLDTSRWLRRNPWQVRDKPVCVALVEFRPSPWQGTGKSTTHKSWKFAAHCINMYNDRNRIWNNDHRPQIQNIRCIDGVYILGTNVVYGCVVSMQDCLARKSDGGFDRQECKEYPERYESNFSTRVSLLHLLDTNKLNKRKASAICMYVETHCMNVISVFVFHYFRASWCKRCQLLSRFDQQSLHCGSVCSPLMSLSLSCAVVFSLVELA